VIPMIHKEIRSGRLPSPMSGGARGMMGMLLGHLVFGLVVAVVYRPFVTNVYLIQLGAVEREQWDGV
jgi:hypothetical protein